MQTKFDENAYSALLERIYSITPSVQNVGFSSDAYKPGLAGMQAFGERLGRPWEKYRCIHVAGTNGKGSVASMIAAALASGGQSGAGTRVGLYTSPHLVDFRERMKVVTADGWTMPSKEEVWEFFQTYLCDSAGELDTHSLSFFEMTTGLAFWWFARQGVDWAVIEAGLGGRLDSTNIITPEISIITSIGLDHCALLGSTRGAIAYEKAGIFKPGVPALVASEDSETAPVFRESAARVDAPLYFADSIIPFIPEEGTSAASRHPAPELPTATETEILSHMDLRGPCQEQNLHTVLVALDILAKRNETANNVEGPEFQGGTFHENGPERGRSCQKKGDLPQKEAKTWKVPPQKLGPSTLKLAITEAMLAAIEKAGKLTGLRGRWEKLQEHPEVVCDIAHNPPALEVNFARLRELQQGRGADGPARPLIIVYGIMADKDLAGIAPLMPEGARYILAAPAIPRALPAEDLKAQLSELRPDLAMETAPSVASAVERALEIAENISTENLPEPFIYIGGSTFVVTEAIEYFNARKK